MTRHLTLALTAALAFASFGPASIASTSAEKSHMPVASNFPTDALLGTWLTQDKDGRVEFVKGDDGTYVGILRWSADPKKDVKNPDPKLRDRSIVGIVLMWHLRYEDGEYVDGRVYNPRDGDVYRMKMEVLGPDSLKIRGYAGIALFGQTQMWSRAR